MDDLARKLATHPRFEWAEGMQTADGLLVAEGFRGALGAYDLTAWDIEAESLAGAAPDLDDPATQGVLRAQLTRDAPEGWLVTCQTWRGGGGVRLANEVGDEVEAFGPPYGEALVRALLWVWGRGGET